MADTKLMDLATRCEQATGPDPYLDEAIMDALFEARPFVQLADAPAGTGFRAWRVNGQTQSAYRFTASLDAAMTLYLRVPERVPSNPRLAAAEALRQWAENV